MIDPSDTDKIERFLAAKEAREQEQEYLAMYHRYIAGGEFGAIGAFATCMFVGYLDHEPLTLYSPHAALLWHPAVAVGLFAVSYVAYLACRSWYAANPPAPDLPAGPRVRLELWIPFGLALAGLVLLGALTGLTACAAGAAVAAWVFAHRRTGGELLLLHAHQRTGGALWRLIARLIARFGAALLAPSSLVVSSVIPPLIGFPAPNLFAVFVLGVLGVVFFTTGCVSAVEYHGYVLRERNTREGGA